MGATVKQRKTGLQSPHICCPQLPPRMRVLYITTRQRTGAWLAEALRADSAIQLDLEEALGMAAGMARLREEIFDVVLVNHLPGELDALHLIEGYRAGGAEEPILVLGAQGEEEMAPLCYRAGADGYLCVNTASTLNLIWAIARGVERQRLLRECKRLNLAEQSRLQREHDEARRMLNEQCALIEDLQPPAGKPGDTPWEMILSPELFAHYKELLRSFVIMGSGKAGVELKRLADLLVKAGLSAAQTMHLHLKVLEELLHGLGARSTRHVMARADLLILELMILLADEYLRQYQQRIDPPQQMVLPGLL